MAPTSFATCKPASLLPCRCPCYQPETSQLLHFTDDLPNWLMLCMPTIESRRSSDRLGTLQVVLP